MSVLDSMKRILKNATGVQGYQDRKEAIVLKENCIKRFDDCSAETIQRRDHLNSRICDFGKIRLESLRDSVGRLLSYMKDMDQKSQIRQFEIINGIDITMETFKEFSSMEMDAKKILEGTASIGVLGTAAALGVSALAPSIVSSAVMSVGVASTGTAISSLGGAAATNAVLAWLGGGSLAAGGGGIAAGAATLSAITTAATIGASGGIALLTAGMLATAHYSKKLTEAKEYEKDVDISIAKMQASWAIMDGIESRVDELLCVTNSLTQRSSLLLDFLEPLAPEFDANDHYYQKTFQKTVIMVKAIADLARTPLLGVDGDLSMESAEIVTKTQKILNTEL